MLNFLANRATTQISSSTEWRRAWLMIQNGSSLSPPFNNFWGGGGDISGELKVSKELSVANISTDNKSFT